jgi:hypothetical protein
MNEEFPPLRPEVFEFRGGGWAAFLIPNSSFLIGHDDDYILYPEICTKWKGYLDV